ncbi:MAG: hypothetical protein L6R36_001052 [Xanthoria steineri]|nr:MAG: hypothetical protein L6R36_001052 [Xanthoria steineri]
MTVDVTIPQETPSLIRPLQRTFYSTRIPPPHPQLKNFISTADHDIIYYACENDIYALHLSAGKREAIATLPWKIQCLDARYGWICVGGPDKGRCAFICIGRQESSSSRSSFSAHGADVDALLPLELDLESRTSNQSYSRRPRASSPPRPSKPEIQIHELAASTQNSITNSVAIHRLRTDQKSQDDDIVCVITNNDSTVRIFSLPQSRLLSTLQFSCYMNHASISPDGQLLVAVGDEPKAFFCRRIPASTSSGDQDANRTWQEIAEPRLNPATLGDACFTTAFSPSGHICAVAQQSGVVTIFDTSRIHEDMEDDDAVLEILKSSRSSMPDEYIGAIRSMSFSPAPWDLLAWAEERGRVCVADLRNACRSRQIVDLDLDSPKLNLTSVTDLEDGQITAEQRELEIERRFLQRHREAMNAQNDLANVSHVADYIELSTARRRRQRDTATEIPGEFNDLTETERQMLDSIRTNRSQENDVSSLEHGTRRPVSGDHLNDQHLDSSEPHFNPQLPALPSNGSFASAQLARVDNMRDAMRRNHLDRSRTADRGTYQPRRRSSVVISNSSNPSNQSSSSHPSSLAPIGTSVPTLSASPSRLASVVANVEHAENGALSTYDSSEAWRTVADAMVNAPLHGLSDTEADQPRGTRREERSRESASASTVFRLLQQTQMQEQQTAPLDRLRSTQAQRSRQHVQAINRSVAGERSYEATGLELLRRPTDPNARREYGVRTMGIGWESHGRSLYVATEEGILELTVNIDERKQLPSKAFT